MTTRRSYGSARWNFVLLWVALTTTATARESDAETQSRNMQRTRSGLMLLYDFRGTESSWIRDRSGAKSPVDLKILDPTAVKRSPGALQVVADTLIRSEGKAARRLRDAIQETGEFSIEVWLRADDLQRKGPARIVTLSKNGSNRNFTLGQELASFDVRFRTTKTDSNGIPSLNSGPHKLEKRLMHVVYTRDRTGVARLYLDGQLCSERIVSGSTDHWGPYRLALGDELSGDRPWRGTYHLLAIFCRRLLPHEIKRHYRIGATFESEHVASVARQRQHHRFQRDIAPLLARRCLECHDGVSSKGGLDLSRRSRALAGGESGPAVVPGSLEDSLIWQYVSTDEMPLDRAPLSQAEKKRLRQWIQQGAEWAPDVIEPQDYAQDGREPQNWVRRLTVTEYINTVRDALGVDIADEARRLLPTDVRADGFSNTAYNLGVDFEHVDAYARLAESIVDRIDVPAFVRRFSLKQDVVSDPSGAEAVARMGQWLFRGKLDDRELGTLLEIAQVVKNSGGDDDEVNRYLIQAMLQSPRFLYRMENQLGDGTAWPVGEHELACRLSYIIWGAPPDRGLLDAAERGDLYSARGLDQQMQRMLSDPRARDRSLQFVDQWLNLGRLASLRPNQERFPTWEPAIAGDMRRETLAFFEDVVWKQQRPLADLLNAQVSFLTPRLARHYGIPLQEQTQEESQSTARYDLSSVEPRGGLLTQGSVLTIGGDEASMVARGLFVLRELLRSTVQDPPPCVNTTPPATETGLTQRGIAEARINNANCGGCHIRFEPLAFGLERFDGLGTYRLTDHHGNPLREDGEVWFPGGERVVRYQSSAQLMNVLATHQRVSECLTWKVTQFAMGRPLTVADAPAVRAIHQEATAAGGTYAHVIRAIIRSSLVQMTHTEKYE